LPSECAASKPIFLPPPPPLRGDEKVVLPPRFAGKYGVPPPSPSVRQRITGFFPLFFMILGFSGLGQILAPFFLPGYEEGSLGFVSPRINFFFKLRPSIPLSHDEPERPSSSKGASFRDRFPAPLVPRRGEFFSSFSSNMEKKGVPPFDGEQLQAPRGNHPPFLVPTFSCQESPLPF